MEKSKPDRREYAWWPGSREPWLAPGTEQSQQPEEDEGGEGKDRSAK